MKNENHQIAKVFSECREKAMLNTNDCFTPNCNEKSINSHILQRNGILSSIAIDNHLWALKVDDFKLPFVEFKRIGLKKIYTYLGFCNPHDDKLFKKIETQDLDFDDYETNLLFTLRTICNEIWLKKVAIKTHNCIINSELLIDRKNLKDGIAQNEIAIKDLSFFENYIWKDLKENTKSFTFRFREISKQEICLNAILTYETTQEIIEFIKKNGAQIDRLSSIFISFFPYKNKSILMMGYHNDDEKKVKSFVNEFFIENEKRVERKITNLILFHCETWVCSDKFHNDKIKGLEELFFKAITFFPSEIKNERNIFDINLFDNKFSEKFKIWHKKHNG
ncbi:hypothetical protein [Flavobacterium succinicans]|nr:hypothetical protein [Flavobacterium succinicans]